MLLHKLLSSNATFAETVKPLRHIVYNTLNKLGRQLCLNKIKKYMFVPKQKLAQVIYPFSNECIPGSAINCWSSKSVIMYCMLYHILPEQYIPGTIYH